jgi:hypothetical protein
MKYGNKKTVFNGLRFDSQGEARRYGELLILERIGKITKLERQVVFQLAPAVKFADEKKKKPSLRFVADFSYRDAEGLLVVEDFKSPVTAAKSDFRIKRHLMKSVHDIDVLVVM